MSTKLEFRPEDFYGKILDLDTEGDRKFVLCLRDAECIAELANARLREMLDSLQAKLDRREEALRSIRDNFDCDNDAHKYETECRCCIAREALGEEK